MTTLLILATGNPHKVHEISAILRGALPGVEFRMASASDFPGIAEPEETGETFRENALLKARYWARATGHLALADDSGLAVDALDGRPGVFSARYDVTAEKRNERVLRELGETATERRSARFICVAAIADPNGHAQCAEGRIEGRIARAPAGAGGFGYDPIFEPLAVGGQPGRTLAQYSPEEKNRISHRGRAFSELAPRVEAAIRDGCVATPEEP